MQNCWGVPYQHVASNEAKILFFCVFFIENSSIFEAKLLGGRLAQCWRNQERALKFWEFFIQIWSVWQEKLPGGSLAKRQRNEECVCIEIGAFFVQKC